MLLDNQKHRTKDIYNFLLIGVLCTIKCVSKF